MKKSFDSVYLKAYRRQNPERVEQWRITSEIRHLRKLGYTVTGPAAEQENPHGEAESHTEDRTTASAERTRIRQAEWRESHRGHLREYHRRWRQAHPENVSRYNRNWRQAHPGYGKVRYARDMEKIRREGNENG